MAYKLDAHPDYQKLKCPKCGNAKEFVELALRETRQPFTVKDGEEDWDAYEEVGEDVFPQQVDCGKCGTTVWDVEGEPAQKGR